MSNNRPNLGSSFVCNAQNVTPRGQYDKAYTAIANQMIGLLWTNQQLADSFQGNKKGWQTEIADALSIDAALLNKAIGFIDPEKIKEMALKNPAGEAPVVLGAKGKLPIQMMNSDVTCGSCGCNAYTAATCGSCGCGTIYCPTPDRPIYRLATTQATPGQQPNIPVLAR